MRINKLRTAIAAAFVAVSVSTSLLAGPLESSVSIEKKMNKDASASQKKITTLSDTTRTLTGDYKAILAKIDQNRAYNRQLELLVANQEKDKASVEKQIEGIEDTESGLVPLMSSMIQALDQFVDLDLPFETELRKSAIESLKNLRERADVTTSEKFRRILEVYKYESLYSMDLDTYQAEIEIGGEKKEVEYFRMGRVAFMHRSRDGKEAAFWDPVNKQWEELPSEYFLALRNAIRMTKNQMQKDIIKLPVRAAEKAQ
ncbi:MAG: DUF3450 domain-containing protein [Pseudomonadota bacterium]